MTISRSFPVFATVFAIVYALVYVVAVENNYALFTYHPADNLFGFLVERPRSGPAMYWYGWMATAAIAAFVAGLIACYDPERLTKHVWSGLSWAVPGVMMLVVAYLLRGFFLR
jgi:hypothetical protein